MRNSKSIVDIKKALDFITISYVQTKSYDENKNNLMPRLWSETVIEGVSLIRESRIFESNANVVYGGISLHLDNTKTHNAPGQQLQICNLLLT